MTQKRFETGKMPQISVVHCQGDLVIRSWIESAVLVKGESYEANESDAGLSLSSQGQLRLTVPETANLSITNVDGDLVIKNVTGDISFGEVGGDVVLSGVSHIKASTVHGDLAAKNVDGPISVDAVMGDAVFRNVSGISANTIHGDISARYVNGAVTIDVIMGDANLHTISGDLTLNECQRDVNLHNLGGLTTVRNANGDIRLQGGLAAGEHAFTAQGDISVRWPPNDALNLVATAPKIINRLTLDKVVEADNELIGSLGDGNTSVTLTSQRRIILKDAQLIREEWGAFQVDDAADFGLNLALDLAGLGEQISAQVNEQVARVTANLESKFGADFAQRMAEKIARKAEQAAVKAERAAEKARRRAEQQMRHSSYGRPTPPPPPTVTSAPPKKKATTEEQLKILRMVEKGVISPDEATMLLDALEEG